MPAVNRTAAKNVATAAAKTRRSKSMDIYMRMNEDPSKDYCFSVPTDQPVSWLHKITETIPVLLSPAYFFHHQPTGFDLSIHPGYLTAEGALLFTDDAHLPKWTKRISQDALIGDVIAEGQLIVPRWKKNQRRHISTILFLMFWLYLDLPEFISPTPGTAPSQVLYWILEEVFLIPISQTESDPFFNNHWWQMLFFSLHTAKVLIIYLILWNGIWHPYSLNPLRRKVKPTLPKPDQLSSIGWTGAKRTPPNDWRGFYIEHRSKRAGGMVEAYRAGELTKPMGLNLELGEGWNALAERHIDDVTVGSDLLDSDGKFVISRPYILELAKPLSVMISKHSTDTDELEMIKNFRRYGYLDGPERLHKLFDELMPNHKELRR